MNKGRMMYYVKERMSDIPEQEINEDEKEVKEFFDSLK